MNPFAAARGDKTAIDPGFRQNSLTAC